MKITSKADYALHAMLYVASINGKHAATISEIAEAESIPREYLAKILKELVGKRILKSKRGIMGGYFLTKPRIDYTFLEIIEAIDGPINPAGCTKPENKRTGHRKGKCAAFAYFDDLRRKIEGDLSAINLNDIPYERYYQVGRGNGSARK